MTLRRLALLAVAIGFPILCSGCVAILAGGAAGAAGYAYFKGAAERHYAEPVDVTAEATRQALNELGLAATVHRGDRLGAILRAESAAGKKIKIEIGPYGSGSVVAVRVGTFGDETISEQIFDRLDRHVAAIVPSGDSPTASVANSPQSNTSTKTR